MPTTRRTSALVYSVGCPSGIGPEVTMSALRENLPKGTKALVVGDRQVIERACKIVKYPWKKLVLVVDPVRFLSEPGDAIGVLSPGMPMNPKDYVFGKPTVTSGAYQLRWVNEALILAGRKQADALITGPINKEMVVRSGAAGYEAFRGHTEHLQYVLGAREVVMAFANPTLTTALVTTHLPLRSVPDAITPRAVATACYWLGHHLNRAKQRGRARIAVCGLNPHAGEHGLLGTEERAIEAGMRRAEKRAQKEGFSLQLSGPVPSESAFRLAKGGAFEGVVAMYHDQATIPMKLLGFGEAVNISLGLPILRTSVDHGTAYDRAGKGTADSSGMRAATELALSLIARARASRPKARSLR